MKIPENISEIALFQPDYLGFIFYGDSPRNMESPIPYIDKSIQKVGVFVNASLDEISSKAKVFGLDYVQLHGDENPDFCGYIQQQNIKVIKSFRVGKNFNFNILEEFNDICSYFLFDTLGSNYGGNGIAFDWSVLQNYNSTKPYFLSGGIGPENIEEIKHFLNHDYAKNCIAIDCNSKLEVSPGLKSIEKTKQLINALKRKT
ncbi:MAG: phosphoribosylanthranilate isomerase [Flavobacterium sp.]